MWPATSARAARIRCRSTPRIRPCWSTSSTPRSATATTEQQTPALHPRCEVTSPPRPRPHRTRPHALALHDALPTYRGDRDLHRDRRRRDHRLGDGHRRQLHRCGRQPRLERHGFGADRHQESDRAGRHRRRLAQRQRQQNNRRLHSIHVAKSHHLRGPGPTARGRTLSPYTTLFRPTAATATYTATDGAETTGSVTVTAGSYTDVAGNLGSSGTDSVPIDTKNPTVLVDIVDASLSDSDNRTTDACTPSTLRSHITSAAPAPPHAAARSRPTRRSSDLPRRPRPTPRPTAPRPPAR